MASDEKLSHTSVENVVDSRQSPPKAIVDCSPLQPAINKNKEALKIKLMVRRPITQLVDQGIIPSLKSSPALHEQRKQLERAKTGDILKAKIQQRPDRQELERRHILEHDESHVDPSLAERQRMLKKARLADQLNSQLSHRPGPLELIKKNILHTEEPIERIVKEGLISFKATSEGLLNRPQQPNGYISYEDDSQSSEGDQQPSPTGQDVVEVVAATAATIEPHEFVISVPTESIVAVPATPALPLVPPSLVSAPTPTMTTPNFFTPTTIAAQTASAVVKPPVESFQVKPETTNLFAELCQSVIDSSTSLNFMATTPKMTTAATLPALTTTVAPQLNLLPSTMPSSKSDAPGKDKNRKKNKLKPIAKARTIKFHEYKGPPNAQKSGSSSLSSEETSYQLLLKQQNCLLEYLEGLNKNPSANGASAGKASETSTFPVNNYLQQAQMSPSSSVSSTIPASPLSNFADTMTLELSKLEKMKVSDLKLLLKTRNLPVSGPKPQLIERLRPFIQSTDADTGPSNDGQIGDDSQDSPRHSLNGEQESVEMQELPVRPPPPPPPPMKMTNDDLLREQQRKIDELQRKLKESQQELQQMQQMKQQPMQTDANQPTVPAPTSQAPKTEVLNQKQIFKQQLEAKIQKEKLLKLENLQKQQMEQQLAYQRKRQENNLLASAVESTKTKNSFAGEKRPQSQQKLQQPQPQPQQTQPPPSQPIITNTNGAYVNHLNQKNGPELIWNGESTLLLVNFPDDKKFLVPNNTMRNIFVPFTATQNMDAILKKVNLGAQLQPQATTVQLASVPKLTSHAQSPQQTGGSPIKIEKFHEMPAVQGTPTHQLISCNSSPTVANLTGMVDILVDGQQLSVQTPYTLAAKTVPSPCNGIAASPSPSLSSTPTSATKPSDFSPVIPSDMILNSTMDSDISPMRGHSICDDMYLNEADIFLNDAAPHDAVAQKMLQQHQHPNQHQQNGIIKKETTEDDHSGMVDMKSFDDLELMELMGQQLDMDISDDSCQPISNMASDKMLNMTSGNTSNGMNSTSSQPMSCRRDMNPSLQPSLSELIQQQQTPSSSSSHGSTSSRLNGSSGSADSNSMHTNYMNPDGLNDYNSNFYLDSNTISGNNNNSLNLGSMDVEYFDPLAQFDFAMSCSNQTNGLMNNNASHLPLYSESDMTNNMALNPSDTNPNDGYGSYYTSGGTAIQNNILDLFNIDDIKMSADPMNWYAV